MQLTDAITFVRRYNAWRRGDDSIPMPHPEDIGRSLVALCDHAEQLGRELEQERQDRKQADLDCLRALGERNDERALADRLATWAQEHRNAYMGQVPHQDCGCGDCQILPVLDADLAAWKEARK